MGKPIHFILIVLNIQLTISTTTKLDSEGISAPSLLPDPQFLKRKIKILLQNSLLRRQSLRNNSKENRIFQTQFSMTKQFLAMEMKLIRLLMKKTLLAG